MQNNIEEIIKFVGADLSNEDFADQARQYLLDLCDEARRLDQALRLALSVAPDDPMLFTVPEKEVFQLRESNRALDETVGQLQDEYTELDMKQLQLKTAVSVLVKDLIADRESGVSDGKTFAAFVPLESFDYLKELIGL